MNGLSSFESLSVGDEIQGRDYRCDNVQLMLYNAALWNGHRIHFDHPYATEVEGYPGLVIAGPLIGDWLTQCIMEWVGDKGELNRLHYSNRAASFVGETLTSGALITEINQDDRTVELEAFVKNEQGDVVAPGTATVCVPR